MVAMFIGTSIIAACLFYEDSLCPYRVQFVCKADESTVENILLFHDENQCYAFLPSYADFSTMHIEYTPGCSLYLDGQFFNSDTDCSGLVVDKEYSMVIRNSIGMTVCQKGLMIKKAENTASLHIHLLNGTIDDINADKEVSKTGYCSLIRENREVDYSGSIKAIHGRGNSTWQAVKKPYVLVLPEKSDLLDMGAGKNWILLANAFDESGLKNKISYDTAKELGMKYAVDSEYVDLYVDNTYDGLYLLAEKVEVGENRVDITDLEKLTQDVNDTDLSLFPPFFSGDDKFRTEKKGYDIPNNPKDITRGYLLQIEHHLEKLYSEKNYFQTHDLSFVVSSPEYISKKQLDYISGICERTEQALRNNDTSGIDLDSFVRYYVMHELFECVDASSCFFFRDSNRIDSKIYAGPIWDFDISIGSGWLTYTTEPIELCYNKTNWFDYLYSNADFRRQLNETYSDVIEPFIVPFVHKKLVEYAEKIEPSFMMNKLRWINDVSPHSWEYRSQIHFNDLADYVSHFKNYFDKRTRMIGKEWKDIQPICSVSFKSTLSVAYYVFFPMYGETIYDNPDPMSDDVTGKYTFLGWYDSEGKKIRREEQ